MKEKIEQNTKLAILGAGCTQEYAEKATKELMHIVDEIRMEAKREVIEDMKSFLDTLRIK